MRWKDRAITFYEHASKIQPKLATLYDLKECSLPKYTDHQVFALCFPKKEAQKTRSVDYSASYLLLDPTVN